MIHFLPNNTVTERRLQGALEILRDPKRWCKVYLRTKGMPIASMVHSIPLVCLCSRFVQSMYLTNLITSEVILCAVRCKSNFGSFALRWACSQTIAMLDCLMTPQKPY